MDDRTKVVPPVTALPMAAAGAGRWRARPSCGASFRPSSICANMRVPAFRNSASTPPTAAPAVMAAIARNAAALDAIELMPRYGIDKGTCDMETELFGKRYAAPIGIAPMGLPGIVWPGAEKYLATAAKRARVPYTAGTVASSTVEELAALAEDMLWFQLYRMPQRDHADGFDLVRRAQSAGAQVLMITMDVPIRTKRPREVRRGLVLPFQDECAHGLGRGDIAGLADVLHGTRPATVFELQALRRGDPTPAKTCRLQQQGSRRRRRILVGRGRALSRCLERPAGRQGHSASGRRDQGGLAWAAMASQVSNHGGRQVEGLPSSIDVLPAIVDAVGKRATVLLDSGVRTGLDVTRGAGARRQCGVRR